jgi:ubiquinone/menaquinone biosynthesis C-methylase UbiE
MSNGTNGIDNDRFDRWADSYDNSLFQRLIFEPMHRFTLSQATARQPGPASILDIGCGTGRLLRRAARRVPDARMTGVDASEEMIRVARASVNGTAPIRFVHGFAEDMPFGDESFDLVVTTMSFHHWSDQSLGLREARRVLAPDGTFVLVDALAAGWVRWFLMRSHHGRFNPPETLERMLQQAGFDGARFVRVPRSGGVVQVVLSQPAPSAGVHRHEQAQQVELSPTA